MFDRFINKEKKEINKFKKDNAIVLLDSEEVIDAVYGYRTFSFLKGYKDMKVFDTIFITDGEVKNINIVNDVSFNSNIINELNVRKIDRLELKNMTFQHGNYVIRVCTSLKDDVRGSNLKNSIVDILVYLKNPDDIEMLYEVKYIIEVIKKNISILEYDRSCTNIGSSVYKYKNRIRLKR